MVSVSPPRKPLELHSMPERIRQGPPASYATAPPPASPPSDDRDWGEARLAYAFLRRSLLRAFSDPAFPSAFPPALPALPSYPAASDLAALPASMSLHSSFQNCYACSRSISLSTVIAP